MKLLTPADDAATRWLDPTDSAWLTEPDPRDPSPATVGLRLPADADDAALNTWGLLLARVDLIGLPFARFVDGRAYSLAWLLRRRHGFEGELRALGDVLVDMAPLLQRCGFDSAVFRADQSLEAAARALGLITEHYQGDVRRPQPLYRRLAGAASLASSGLAP